MMTMVVQDCTRWTGTVNGWRRGAAAGCRDPAADRPGGPAAVRGLRVRRDDRRGDRGRGRGRGGHHLQGVRHQGGHRARAAGPHRRRGRHGQLRRAHRGRDQPRRADPAGRARRTAACTNAAATSSPCSAQAPRSMPPSPTSTPEASAGTSRRRRALDDQHAGSRRCPGPRPDHHPGHAKPKLRSIRQAISGLGWAFTVVAGWRSGYFEVSGIAVPMSSKACRWTLVGSVSIAMVSWVPVYRTWLRVKVARCSSRPRKLR